MIVFVVSFFRVNIRRVSESRVPEVHLPSAASHQPVYGLITWVRSSVCGWTGITVREKMCIKNAFQAPAGNRVCSVGGGSAVGHTPAEVCCLPRTLDPLRRPEQRHLLVGSDE